ncbi:hypothetical protein QBA54_00360 [Streptomyces sp. B21-108]
MSEAITARWAGRFCVTSIFAVIAATPLGGTEPAPAGSQEHDT